MDYIALHVPTTDETQSEILTAELADYPFESFESEAGVLKAYIRKEALPDCKDEVDALLGRYGCRGRYIAIETQNWNALWEQNFPWVDVEGRLRIRAPFHEAAPAGEAEVVLMPKMSFGTGHHATTWLMARALLDLELEGRTYDFIVANINRNILTADMGAYAAALRPGGDLLMSGFFEEDVAAIRAAAEGFGLRYAATASRDGWALVHMRREA